MDAAEKGTNVSELDPRDRTVGYGGDPNEDGFHQLDASVMNGADTNNIGAAGATGHGEECVKVSATRIIVEKMREGLSPSDACRNICEVVASRHGGKPMFGLNVVALNKNGEYGCCTLRGSLDDEGTVTGLGFCVQDAKGHRLEPGDALLPPMTQEELDAIPWR